MSRLWQGGSPVPRSAGDRSSDPGHGLGVERRPRSARARRLTALSVLALAITSCSSSDSNELNASTTCGEYLKRESSERHDAAVRISAEIEGVENPGNPMWGLSLDAACGSAQEMTLGEYFGQGPTPGETTSEGPSAGVQIPTRPEEPADSKYESPYSEEPVQFKTSEGWSYTYTPSFDGKFALKVTKDISQSPPGRARLVYEFETPPTTLDIQSNDEGRSAPPVTFDLGQAVFQLSDSDPGIFGEMEGSDDPACDLDDDFWDYRAEFLSLSRPEAKQDYSIALVCTTSIEPSSASGWIEFEESDVDRVIEDLSDTSDPIVATRLTRDNSKLGCEVIFFPDGEASVGTTLSENDCG